MTGLQFTDADADPSPIDRRGISLRDIVFYSGISVAIFVAGMGYGRVASQGNIIQGHLIDAKSAYAQMADVFIRKDGRELEEIIGKLNLLTQKVDNLQQVGRRRP